VTGATQGGRAAEAARLATEAADCTRCPLHERATQVLFGEGRLDARLFLIGEQPGDQEDKQGHPFVGPAGHVLDRALAEAGVDRDHVYLTNAVKHFKWQARGKRRIHQRPNGSEIRACRHWLEAELALVRPRLVVLLGAVAGESVFGSRYRVGEHRGEPRDAAAGDWEGQVLGTIHPSSILRGPDEKARSDAYAGLVADLRAASAAVGSLPRSGWCAGGWVCTCNAWVVRGTMAGNRSPGCARWSRGVWSVQKATCRLGRAALVQASRRCGVADRPATAGRFRHLAFFYATPGGYATEIAEFLRAGLAAGEAGFVAVPPDGMALVKDALGADAAHVEFADMTELGRNPGRIIVRVSDFTSKHHGRPVRYVGEPVWASRGPAELREACLHESLINLAFADTSAQILCPYDTSALSADVVADATRTHPLLLSDGRLRTSPEYAVPFRIPANCSLPLPPPPPDAMPYTYRTDLSEVRTLVYKHARDAGLAAARANDLVLAVSEVAANTLRHTQSTGTLTIWYDDDEIVCEVHDEGVIADPLVGRRRPSPDADGGHGLWLVHQVCDLVELRSGDKGTTIRMHMTIEGGDEDALTSPGALSYDCRANPPRGRLVW
jgi:uracil-DNA glycosylase family protein